MCIAPDRLQGVKDKVPQDATDVPLGDGLADQAKLSILSRRERIRAAVEGTSGEVRLGKIQRVPTEAISAEEFRKQALPLKTAPGDPHFSELNLRYGETTGVGNPTSYLNARSIQHRRDM